MSSSSELKTFLLSMCIEAPESTTKSRSSDDFEVGAGVALASTGEFHAALSALLSLQICFAKVHAALRGASFLFARLTL